MSEKAKAILAVNGGPKAIQTPIPARHHFTEAEKAACIRVLDEAIAAGTAPTYGGSEEEAFCEEFAALLSDRKGYADAVNSGSTAVFVALRALELPAFSEVIVPPFTDPGGIMSVVMANCIPVVADTSPGSFNMSLESIEALTTERTSAILATHIAGEPADMECICRFAKEKGIYVVEDCAQAHGAHSNGQAVGTFGDIAAFSFMYSKHVCTGGQGGMVYTQNEALYWKIRQHSDRGKPFGLPSGASNCVASLNFNMDSIHCAIGRDQIKKIQVIANGRRAVANEIMANLADLPMVRPIPLPEGAESSYWFFRLLLDFEKLSCDKRTFCAALSAEGLGNSGEYALPFTYEWYPNRNVFGESGYPWASPLYTGDREKVFTLADTPNACKAMHDTVILYPHEGWTKVNAKEAANAIRKVCHAYAK